MSETYALITGASSGIGRAVAKRLAAKSNIVLHGRDEARLAEAAAACNSDRHHRVWRHDLGDVVGVADSLTGFLQNADAFVDCFIHCAGIATVLPMRAVDQKTAARSFNVNFLSAMEIIRVLLQKKINHGSLKNIVLISSTHAIRGAKGYSLYAATKGAVDAYMRALAIELAPAVRVNTVAPGAVRTPMAAEAFKDAAFVAQLQNTHPLGIGEPDDIASAIEFLVSNDARWITGQTLVVDGGRTTL
jgi:NAD(P)-dependent dehydrogenase (short-subunit alcohol dehydrogenase family)